MRLIARRGAEVLVYTHLPDVFRITLTETPVELLDVEPSMWGSLVRGSDAAIVIDAPHDTRSLEGVDPDRLQRFARGHEALKSHRLNNVRWVICNYPTDALAADAGMTLTEYADFVYDACLIDWTLIESRTRALKTAMDGARQVEIVGPGTELSLSLDGRIGQVADGKRNIPDGETFWSPVEDSTEGVVRFDFPAIHNGHEVSGVELEFRGGRVVRASAVSGQEFLESVLDTDPGARVLGELGVGVNYGITRFTKSILFDEKIGGTVHLALGNGFQHIGGRNVSAIHWDMIKDLRAGGELRADGRVIQADGEFTIFPT